MGRRSLKRDPPRATKREGIASTARAVTKWIINIDAQDRQDMVLGVWCLVIPLIGKPAPDHRPIRLLVHQALVLYILCILCIDVNKKYRFPAPVPA